MDIALEDAPAPSDNELKSVQELAREQYALERHIDDLEQQLKDAKARLKVVNETELPQLMQEIGLNGLTLANGWKLDLKSQVFANIAKDKAEAAHAWLEKEGHGDIIKRQFIISFSRDDELWAKKFRADLDKRKKKLAYDVKRAVHPQTLGAWVREALIAGLSIPEDLFGIYRQKITVLTPPKKPL